MILSAEELESLVSARNGQPHSWLGLHPLGTGNGIVARAFQPDAAKVEVVPVHPEFAPPMTLERIHDSGMFEGVTREVDSVFAYDLRVTYADGSVVQHRDPYSFLPTISETDLYYFGQGEDTRLYHRLGAHEQAIDGVSGVAFNVWAPNAQRVSVVGEFNYWDGRRHMMRQLGPSGVWEIFIPGVAKGALYKFEIRKNDGGITLKTDPFGFFFESPPKQASIVWDTRHFDWSDDQWMSDRSEWNPFENPMSTYEVHMGSWKKKGANESYSYRELAEPLIEYVVSLGFTHVEFLPVAEHAYYPSWGYQVTGFFAPSSRYGTPDDFQYLVNELHRAGIGVIIDWVPAHFPKDEWCLARFDGTALYEHADPRMGEHQDWGTYVFNFGRHEVRNFLIANALYWLDRFHIDGLRVDAVASMLYLDYSRNDGDWIPNQYGGRENLDAIAFLRRFNELCHTEFPGVVTIAEESTAWPQVSRPPYLGGLGFSLKWNMGWMNDTLNYFRLDSIFRKYHQNDLTFAMVYHYQENFVLPLSHDEVVHGKGSLLGRMPGDDWQRFANLRCLLSYQWVFPGKKLLFMGGEFGHSAEWNESAELDWDLLNRGPYHIGAQRMVQALNTLYREEPALHQSEFDSRGFYWVDCSDYESSILIFVRQTVDSMRRALVVLNLTPVPREGYVIGVPESGAWVERFNSDALDFGGSGQGNSSAIDAVEPGAMGQPHGVKVTLAPLSVMVFSPEAQLVSEG